MPQRITVKGPEEAEELRQWAESIADLHYVLALTVENAKELVPGEAVEELTEAWAKAQDPFESLVKQLAPSNPNETEKMIKHSELEKEQLHGEVGKIKRSTLSRLKDFFLMFWNANPRTDEKRAKAAEGLHRYLEFFETIAASIPGGHLVAELCSLVKQLVGLRSKREVQEVAQNPVQDRKALTLLI